MLRVQIFGVKNSQATRAAERFFRERRIDLQFVDLNRKPMSPAEIKRFIAKFGWPALIDSESKAYQEAGLKYLKVSESDLAARVEEEPQLLRLPLVRGGNQLSIGLDQEGWKAMLVQ